MDVKCTIFKNLQEYIGNENIDKCFENNQCANVYWGTAPTGKPHIAYYLAMSKLADFLRSKCHVTVLFADLHAYLDNMKAPWELLDKRTKYYEILIKGMLKSLKVPLEKLRFIKGTEYQLEENYTKMVYTIISLTSFRDAEKAGCDVVKQNQDPLMSSIVYPLLQALDEEFLNVDIQFGGVDQRKIFMYAEKYLPNMNFSKRSHLMNPMIPGLTGGKMSASEENSKIDLLDSAEVIKHKLQNANSVGKNAEDNGVLAFIKYVLLPNKELIESNSLDDYQDYETLEADFLSGKLDLNKLKYIIEDCVVSMTKDLKNEFSLSGYPNIISEAYPKAVNTDDHTELLSNDMFTMKDFPEAFSSLRKEFPGANENLSNYPTIKKTPKILWSCRASGEPHIGYLLPIFKLANLSNSGWEIVILIEDIGAQLHSKYDLNRPKSPESMFSRAQLYKSVLKTCYKYYNGDESKLIISIGSEYQLSKNFALKFYQSLSNLTYSYSKNFIEKNLDNSEDTLSRLSSLIYPVLWSLDSLYHDVCVRVVGNNIDADNSCLFINRIAEKLHENNKIPQFVKHELILSLNADSPMSSPVIGAPTAPKDKSSISLCHDFDSIKRNLKKAFFDPKQLERDPSLSIIENIIWNTLTIKEFRVDRTEENGGVRIYDNLSTLKKELIEDLMHPGDVKDAIMNYLLNILTQVRSIDNFEQLYKDAYENVVKKVKIGKKDFNPNKIDLRVARICSIVYCKSFYTIKLKAGLEIFEVKNSKKMYGLPVGANVIILTIPGQNDVFHLLTDQNDNVIQLDGHDQNNSIVFQHHAAVLPNMKLIDLDLAKTLVENDLHIIGNKLIWNKNNCSALGIRLKQTYDVTQSARILNI